MDGRTVGAQRIERSIPFLFSESAAIGTDIGTALTDDYGLPFPFMGEMNQIRIDFGKDAARKN